MKTRVIGVTTAIAAIAIVFIAIVFTIAAIQDYQENKGQSFIERAASIIGIGTLTEPEEAAQVKIEIVDDDDAAKPDTKPADAPDILRFFLESEGTEEWPDDLLDGGWLGPDSSFRFEDRVERLTPFERFFGIPSDRFEFEDPRRAEWIDQLVERGFMTEEDADEFRSWFEDLPKGLDEWAPDFPEDREFEFDSDDGRFRFRWRWDGSGDDQFFENYEEYEKNTKNGA